MAKKRKPQPLAIPPQSSALRSRKRARQVTTLFHKYTQERDAAVAKAKAAGCSNCIDDDDTIKDSNHKEDSTLSPHQIQLLAEIKKWDDKLSEIGGREEYQRASQMNTSLFSTSKWVLGILGRIGWLDGLPLSSGTDNTTRSKSKKKEKIQRRNIRLLEVGAINTQLLDASERTRIRTNHTSSDTRQQDGNNEMKKESGDSAYQTERVYHLDVKAIDIRSTDARIEQLDFFDLPLPNCNNLDSATFSTTSNQQQQAYDVIVNSMVINCVTTPAKRGSMLHLCYKQLRPGGMCFITLPKLCLIQSKFMTKSYFEEILKAVGFEIMEDMGRESPKISFFVLKRPKLEDEDMNKRWNDKFTKTTTINRGKKFRNTFAVTLNKEEVYISLKYVYP